MKKLKPTITTKQYVEQQIVKYLTDAVIYEAQLRVIKKTLEDENKKENAIKAIGAIEQQIQAGKEALKVWEEFLNEL